MPTAAPVKSVRRRNQPDRAGLASGEIQRRLEQIELSTVSSLRALQMDIDCDPGVPSAVVLKRARAALR
jgi:hypothetical protein